MPRKRKNDLDEYTTERMKSVEFANAIRHREIFEASVRRGFQDIDEGRTITLHELKVKMGDAPPLVGVLAHPCNVRKPTGDLV